MKKLFSILIITLIWVMWANAELTLTSSDIKSNTDKWYILSDNYLSYNTCITQRDKNNTEYTSYKRSDCFKDSEWYKYFICKLSDSCEIGWVTSTSVTAQWVNVSSSTVSTSSTTSSVTTQTTVTNQDKLDAFLSKVRTMKSSMSSTKYEKFLDTVIDKLNILWIKYKSNTTITEMVVYLTTWVKWIKEEFTKTKDVDNFFCELTDSCESEVSPVTINENNSTSVENNSNEVSGSTVSSVTTNKENTTSIENSSNEVSGSTSNNINTFNISASKSEDNTIKVDYNIPISSWYKICLITFWDKPDMYISYDEGKTFIVGNGSTSWLKLSDTWFNWYRFFWVNSDNWYLNIYCWKIPNANYRDLEKIIPSTKLSSVINSPITSIFVSQIPGNNKIKTCSWSTKAEIIPSADNSQSCSFTWPSKNLWEVYKWTWTNWWTLNWTCWNDGNWNNVIVNCPNKSTSGKTFNQEEVNNYINQVWKTNHPAIAKAIIEYETQWYTWIRQLVANYLWVSTNDINKYIESIKPTLSVDKTLINVWEWVTFKWSANWWQNCYTMVNWNKVSNVSWNSWTIPIQTVNDPATYKNSIVCSFNWIEKSSDTITVVVNNNKKTFTQEEVNSYIQQVWRTNYTEIAKAILSYESQWYTQVREKVAISLWVTLQQVNDYLNAYLNPTTKQLDYSWIKTELSNMVKSWITDWHVYAKWIISKENLWYLWVREMLSNMSNWSLSMQTINEFLKVHYNR